MQLEYAIFRKEDDFSPANLQHYLPFWEYEILRDHPYKQAILGSPKGVKLEEFLLHLQFFKGSNCIHIIHSQTNLKIMLHPSFRIS